VTEPTLRYEIKLVCASHERARARAWIGLHPAGFVVAYPPRRVNSLYWDTLHLSSLDANLAGLNVRNKLRCRWYGDDVAAIQPHLELKHKRNLLGYKKQIIPPCTLDLTRSWHEILQSLRAHIDAEWYLIFQTVNQPTLLNHYWREYYVTPDGLVRVTLDYNQVTYDQRFCLRPNLNLKLPIADTVVIEIKADQAHADRVQDIVSQFPIPRTRNSKYAEGMLAALYSQ